MKHLCIYLCMLICVVFPADLADAKDIALPNPLTLESCIQFALEHGFDMKIEDEQLAIEREELPIAQSEFDPHIAVETSRGATRFAAPSALSPATRSEHFDNRIGITQRLRTGTLVSFDTRLNRFASDPAFIVNPAYDSDVRVALRQPLIKGFGSSITTLPIRRAEVSIDLAQHSYKDRALDIIEATENAYYFLAGAHEQLAVFKTGLTLAEAFLKEVQVRRRVDLAIELDIVEAQTGVAEANGNVIEAEKFTRTGAHTLLALLGQFELDIPLGPIVLDTAAAEETLSVQSSYEQALQNAPALLAARSASELATVDERFAKDDLKPSVDLELVMGFNGVGGNRGDAFAGAFAPDGGTWQVGFTLSYPIGRAAQKARWRQSRAAVNREESRVKNLEQDINRRVHAAVLEVQTQRKIVSNAAERVRLNVLRHKVRKERYQQGVSKSRDVLEAQTELEQARLAHLQARLDLLSAQAALHRLEGSALERYGVTLRLLASDD